MTQGHCGRCGETYEACSCEKGPRDFEVAQVGVLERMAGELRRAQEMLSLAELRVREDQARIEKLERVAEAAREMLDAPAGSIVRWQDAVRLALSALEAKEPGP